MNDQIIAEVRAGVLNEHRPNRYWQFDSMHTNEQIISIDTFGGFIYIYMLFIYLCIYLSIYLFICVDPFWLGMWEFSSTPSTINTLNAQLLHVSTWTLLLFLASTQQRYPQTLRFSGLSDSQILWIEGKESCREEHGQSRFFQLVLQCLYATIYTMSYHMGLMCLYRCPSFFYAYLSTYLRT